MARTKKINDLPLTTSQSLGSLIKSVRDIMRKDKGLSGDLDRLPMLTWIMFLKFLDDMEQVRETGAAVAGKRYKPLIEPPYRWRDWAAKEEGLTGEALIKFIDADEAIGPDGKKGAGLFAYLRSLQSSNGQDRRDVIRMVYSRIRNRMESGYLLREILNKVNGIHFTSSDEIHTLGHFYESMLREMRDAAGDSGEFYTPRPVIRFIVEVINPRLGETILDPACGTGGFLVESYEHLRKQCKKAEDHAVLQRESLFGVEAKPLPYLLCQMNLLLHGLEFPQIDPGNALRNPLREIGDKDRVDIVMTNPPFGGEEERGIQSNFPDDKRTNETALLFFQLIMRKLSRKKPGRAAVVFPNPTLSADKVAARIKAELLEEFNLHTILRLPEGVFEPYTGIPTNVLFFDKKGPTKDIWYYQICLPEGLRKFTKNKPLQIEHFTSCLSWWNDRRENEFAWRIHANELFERDDSGAVLAVDLDRKNPRAKLDVDHLPPGELLGGILKKQRFALSLLEALEKEIQ